MSTVRQRAKTAVKPDKKVVKPVLANSLTIGWPELSKPAQAQIETALWELLKPVAQIREEQYHSASNESAEQIPPQASTSRVTLDMPARPNDPEAPAPEKSVAVQDVPLPVDDAANPSVDSERAMSKRAKRRAKVRQQVEKRDAHLPPSVHEIHLRSDRLVQIPDRLHPDGFLRKLRLDADKAITTRPAICDAMVIGLNAVTRSLEEAVDNSRRRLAGLPIIASSGKVSSQDNLRLFIPSPSRGTRRDRRVLRERLHPTSRSSKYASRAKKLLSRLPESPAHISVPRNEPSLVSALESVLHSSKLSQQTSEDKMREIAVTALLNTVRGESSPDNASDMKVDEATANSTENASVRIPSSDIEKLLLIDKPSVTDPHDRDLLLSLFTRFNPNYFRTEQDRFQKFRSIARYKLLAKAAAEIDDTPPVEKKPLRLVFVAKEDINPLRIAEHLLMTVAAQNSLNMAKRRDFRDDSDSSGINDDVYLVPLGKGAEEKMAKLLGFRRVSVLAFTGDLTPEYAKLVQLVKTHLPQPLSADWLIPATNSLGQLDERHANLVPTRVKHLHTTAPADIKGLRVEKLGEKTRKRKEAQGKAGDGRQQKKARANEMAGQQPLESTSPSGMSTDDMASALGVSGSSSNSE